jgi:hypothetical protein
VVPDASALLVRHESRARAAAARRRGNVAVTELTELGGDIDEAASGPTARLVLDQRFGSPDAGSSTPTAERPRVTGRAAARRAEVRSRFATNPSGDRIHMFVVDTGRRGSVPYGVQHPRRPEWHERDRFDPETQAFVDNGFAVAVINYRGSTGYGIAFREALLDNVCFTETGGHPRRAWTARVADWRHRP